MDTRIGLSLLVTVALGVLGAQNQPGIKAIPVVATSAASGQQMFDTYCAVCHGKEGRGDGPAAAALKKAPADLTLIAARNKGTFPEFDIRHSISGDAVIAAHGSREMPVWGDLLRSLDGGSDSITQLRIDNLAKYIKSLQKK
jgi:mono/diheme cytochrome c family protein